MGVELPGAHFVGVDFSDSQIETGTRFRNRAGVNNVDLRNVDVMEIDASWGKFDYIVAHGLFSWVPHAVQEKILSICHENLTPDGCAYISYNTYPGWHFRHGLREMMIFHALSADSPLARTEKARELLSFLSSQGGPGAYGQQFRDHFELLKDKPDSYLFHDYLETENNPLYFHEFVARASRYGLEYLCDSSLSPFNLQRLDSAASAVVQKFSDTDLIRQEQYLDFVVNRTFRASVLVHAGQGPGRISDSRHIGSLWLAMNARVDGGKYDPTSEIAPALILDDGRKIRMATADPVYRAAISTLIEHSPQSIRFEELVAIARAQAGSVNSFSADETSLQIQLFEAFKHGVVEPLFQPWRSAASVGDKPQTTLLARLQAESSDGITTLNHKLMYPPPKIRELIKLLDGRHTAGELADLLLPKIASGGASTADDYRAKLSGDLANVLAYLRGQGILLAAPEEVPLGCRPFGQWME